jgi:hypothetical protein
MHSKLSREMTGEGEEREVEVEIPSGERFRHNRGGETDHPQDWSCRGYERGRSRNQREARPSGLAGG